MTNDEVIALVCDPETRLVGATIFDAFARVNIGKDVGGALVTNDDHVTFTQLRAAVREVTTERDAAIARAEAAEALAASRPEITPEMADEWYAGEPSGAFLAALRAHAAKVNR